VSASCAVDLPAWYEGAITSMKSGWYSPIKAIEACLREAFSQWQRSTPATDLKWSYSTLADVGEETSTSGVQEDRVDEACGVLSQD